MKRHKQTKKQTRESFDGTIAERQHSVLLGGQQPKTPARAVAAAWRWHNWLKRNPHVKPSELLTKFETMKANVTAAFINSALAEWKPEMLVELAREMKRSIPEKFEPDKKAWCLLEASREGELNLSQLQREAEKRKVLALHLRTWRRKAHELKLQIRDPGTPTK